MESIFGLLPNFLDNEMQNYSKEELASIFLIVALIFIVLMAVYIFFVFLLLKLNKRIFKRIEKKKGSSITVQFLQKAISLAIIVVWGVIPLGGKKLAQSLLGSTAVVAAVVGLAANDVIKNMFAGLEISIYKPFDVGSRIMFEDGTAGIVEKLTLRHVVLKLVDTTRLIVPNSKANTAVIINYSYEEQVPRSIEMHFPISYDSDIDKAKEVIRTTIASCELTLNEDKYKENDPKTRSVYFLELRDSSLIMGATVYYGHGVRTELVRDEVNTKVFKALAENGIEIPYNYMNVVMRDGSNDKKAIAMQEVG
ncbi:mechanosensitive ion channel family protein [Butyrivibrio sp. VCB2006]|uniref:mechanosensitive ion channel family protein n=1 Tax=Butyrivibrio sp. VCB2006 TaxID=1280679 RepID=UPI0012DC674B|nr:mechanosensitive ion channel family protein [Butyrivibrio sp. VCB2006]